VMVARGVGSRSMLRTVLAEGGFSELYRGLGAAALTWVPYLSLYFVAYESLCARFGPARPLLGDDGALRGTADEAKDPPFLVALGCGLAAGVGAAAITNPFDVVRTRVQIGGAGAPSSAIGMARHIARTEGAHGFTRGIFARCMLLAPTSSLTVSLFASLKAAADGFGADAGVQSAGAKEKRRATG